MKLIDLVNSVIIFLSQTTSFYLLLRLLTFLLRSQDCDSHNRGLLDLLIYSHASICSTMVFSLGNSDVFISISIDFLSNWKWDSPFHCIDYSCADWDGLYDHLRDITWEEIFKLSASELPVNSVGGFRMELMCFMQHGVRFTEVWHMWFFTGTDLISKTQKNTQYTQGPVDWHTHENVHLHHLLCAQSSYFYYIKWLNE